MSAFQHPRSGPQEPPFLKQNTLPTQDKELRLLNQRSPNHTGPVYSGDPHGFSNQFIQPPPQIDMPPYRAHIPQGFLSPVRHHYIPRQQLHRQVSLQLSNSASSATTSPAISVESPQAPELPPKPHSGLQPQYQQNIQQHQQPQYPQPQYQLQPQQQQQLQQLQQLQQQQQYVDPYAFPPPPVPARPVQKLAVEAVPTQREQPSSEKRPTSGRLNGAESNLSAQLEELSRDPGAVAEKLKRVAEVLTAFPRKYEAAIQGKTKMLQESILLGQQDLRLLREELQKARNSLVKSQTDTHTLLGEMQILKQENVQLGKQAEGLPEPCYTDEETQLLIADLRTQIVDIKSEVPDPNLCDSLRLMIKLLEEDRKAVEKKYTQVSEDLHGRDNEISRLMKEHEASGNFIQEGRTGLEKHFNAQMEELRRERNSLSQQLEIANQKLEVSQRRDATENEPGPSRVELQGIIESANVFQDQLQARIRERDEEVTRLKKQLVDSREVISSSYTGAVNPNSTGRVNSQVNSNSSFSSSEMEAKLNEEILGLKIENRNLDREVRELKKYGSKDTLLVESGRLERELTGERERIRRYERIIEEKEAELQQMLTTVDQGHKDSEKDDMIETLLGTKASLSQQLDELKLKLEDQKQQKNEIMVLRNWLEGRDGYIQRINDSMTQQNKELDYFKRLADDYGRRSKDQMDFCNKLKEDLAKSDNSLQWFKQRARELETKQSSTPNFNTAKEVYDAHVEQLTQEIETVRTEKKKVENICGELETKIRKLESELKDLSVLFAQLKNERQQPMPGYPHNMYYMQEPSGAARIHEPYNIPRAPPGRDYVQGRDPGVPYPNPKN